MYQWRPSRTSFRQQQQQQQQQKKTIKATMPRGGGGLLYGTDGDARRKF